jgi:hypothetical protein
VIHTERVYLHTTTENGSTVYICKGASEQQLCFAGVASLGRRAQQEDGMKVFVVWLLVKDKGMDITDELAEGRG